MNRSTVAAAVAAALAFAGIGQTIAGPLDDLMAAGDPAAALKRLQPLADAGNAEAQFKVGLLYQTGAAGAEDDAKALIWIRKAIAQGYGPAKSWLILMCVAPNGPPAQDCEPAYADLRASAEKGDPQSQLQLGAFYMIGKGGVEKDTAKGVEWTRKAADKGYVAAERQMGLYYSSSLFGVSQDQAQSLSWYEKGAAQGDVASMDALGMAYQMGLNAPKDPAQSASWYRKAADLGDMIAQTSLADMYDKGDGVPKDPAQAFGWYRKLADKGVTDAQAKVGSAYALGKGVPQDYVQAYIWLDVAVAGAGPGDAGDNTLARDSVGSHLTPAQLADAKRQSTALQAKIGAQ